MSNWTPEAKERLDEYLSTVGRISESRGEDTGEIVEGLSIHIRTEAEKHSGSVVTLEHVQRALAAMGSPEDILGTESTQPPSQCATPAVQGTNGNGTKPLQEQAATGIGTSVLIYLFGVAIPLLSMGFELFTGVMATIFVDPIPTVWHIVAGLVLIGSIVVSDMSLRMAGRSGHIRWPEWVLFLNAYAVGLSLIYTLIYLPIIPVATFAILGFGAGIMGFSPVFCLACSLAQMRRFYIHISSHAEFPVRKAILRSAGGAAVVVLLTAGYAGPELLSRKLIDMAISADKDSRSRGFWWLQALSLEETVLKTCYRPIGIGLPGNRRWSESEVSRLAGSRELYFRMTGQPYNSVPRPKMKVSRTLADIGTLEEERIADSEVGGMAVAGRVAGLSLRGSHIDANIVHLGGESGDPALAYMEWIIEFRNDSDNQREARAQIELPHGGVASRLTLWIEGEEREAAFGARQQVREAYQKVAVVRRRDPALLNIAGPDKLLLQCFPVQPQSTMKLKIGITAPLVIRNGTGYLRMPYFSERNFTVLPEFRHDIWVECDSTVRAKSPMLTSHTPVNGWSMLRGELSEESLQSPNSGIVEVEQGTITGTRWRDVLQQTEASMSVEPAAGQAREGEKYCLVVDGSASMRALPLNWSRLMEQLPRQAEVAAIFAGQEVEVYGRGFQVPGTDMATWLDDRIYRGGCDPIPALEKAWELASANRASIVWVHGPLPVELSSIEGIRQWNRRRAMGGDGAPSRLLTIEAVQGPNRVLEQLGEIGGVFRVPQLESLEATLAFALARLAPGEVTHHFSITATPEAAVSPVIGFATGHLARLAIADHAWKVHQGHLTQEIEPVASLAATSRLVTPLTGAVVLEQAAQYEEFGLDPSENMESIPGIPEPEEWALIVVAGVTFILLLWVQRKTRATGAHTA